MNLGLQLTTHISLISQVIILLPSACPFSLFLLSSEFWGRMGQLLCNGEHAEAYGQRVTCHAKYIKSLLSRARSPTRHPSAAHSVCPLTQAWSRGPECVTTLQREGIPCGVPVIFTARVCREKWGKCGGHREIREGGVRSERPEEQMGIPRRSQAMAVVESWSRGWTTPSDSSAWIYP